MINHTENEDLKEAKINRTQIEVAARSEFGKMTAEGYKYYMLVMKTLEAERVLGH